MGRMTRWLRDSDGVNTLLADRSEIGKLNFYINNITIINIIIHN